MKNYQIQTVIVIAILTLAGNRAHAELVGWWTFDDNVTDQSGKGNDGELFASYASNVPAVIGAGKSLQLADDTEHVYIEENPSLDSDIFTLSMFLLDRGQQDSCDQAGTTCAMERLTSRQSDTFETALNVHPPFGGTGELSFYSGSSGWLRSDYVLPIDGWQHVAYVADGELMTVYADGKIVDERSFTSAPTGFMHIGNRWNDVEGFVGLMDDVALWDEALPQATIAALASGKQRPGGQPVGIPGDFDANGKLESSDIDTLAAAIRANSTEASFDLDKNSKVDLADHSHWVLNLRKTYFGDSNLDGEFSSTDFVAVFQSGEYEDALGLNSKWSTGDWNGDAEFNSSDFVSAFQGGGFEKGPRQAISAVPEPNGCLLLAIALISLRRKRS